MRFFASTCTLNRQRTRREKAQKLGTPKIRDTWPSLILGEETEEHITNPKLAQQEMAENLTIPQLQRKENEKNFADELPKLEDQKSQQKLEAIVGYQASIFELLALGSQELAEHIATIGKNRAKLAVEKIFRAHAYRLVKISFGDSELAAKIRTEKHFQLRIRHRFRDRQLAHSLDPMTFHIRSLDPMTFQYPELRPDDLPYPELRPDDLPYPELRPDDLPYPELRPDDLPFPELRPHELPYPELRQQQLVNKGA